MLVLRQQQRCPVHLGGVSLPCLDSKFLSARGDVNETELRDAKLKLTLVTARRLWRTPNLCDQSNRIAHRSDIKDSTFTWQWPLPRRRRLPHYLNTGLGQMETSQKLDAILARQGGRVSSLLRKKVQADWNINLKIEISLSCLRRSYCRINQVNYGPERET